MGRNRVVLLLLCLVIMPAVAFGQQTGSISGKVIGTDNLVIPGVTVEARSNVLPGPRVTVTGSIGEFRLPALPPGAYTVTFDLTGMAKITKDVQVLLAQDATLNVTMGIGAVTESVTVTAEAPVMERTSTALKSGVSAQTIQSLPTGQEYRDLIKLIPGVQVTQESVRGPSAGGSGQDNVYKFDGVNVTLPLFGTLSAEPASYDIAEVTTIKGGAKAIDFERSGGFSVDSVSKTGTSRYSGQASYQFQTAGMAAKLQNGSLSKYSKGLTWVTANLGGPVIPDHAFFYGSYYRPGQTRVNRANLYSSLPDYSSTRNEGFGKMTLTPTSNILLNASYRYSHTLSKSDLFGQATASTAGTGGESRQRIATADGSWIINSSSFASFKYTHYKNPTQSRPDNVSTAVVNTAIGTRIDVNSLDTLGLLTVPTPINGQDAYNAFIQPLIDRYGYVSSTGVKTGSGLVGYGTLFDEDNFFRNAWQVAYNLNLGSTMTHDIHIGYQRYTDSEDLIRSSNGWGSITVPGGRSASLGINGIPAFYIAAFQQQTTGAVPPIHSSYWSQSVEVNDTIRSGNVSMNIGLLASNDRLYGQGLREDSSTVSGYVASLGTIYKMYEIPFKKMLQPRLGATWAYNGQGTIYASAATYVPAASSLPRAASWGRNLATTINAYFDASGVLYGVAPIAGSTGKLFVPGMMPRTVTEYLLGTSRQVTPHMTARAYFRYRYAHHFWEDTQNNARLNFGMPAGWGPAAFYIPNLTDRLTQIGVSSSNNAYVITELDRSYTRYYEATLESEYRSNKVYVRGSYTWSRYRGNFDQDNTSSTDNDANRFIGSSNIGDGAGRQLWNFKDGTLRGDRPHTLKLYGYYQLPWRATVGAFALAQSGQPWEKTSYEPYIALTTSTSDTNRYAEPAGSRRTPAWYQIDLNYNQSIPLTGHYRFQVVADLYNVFNTQTGYNYVQSVHSASFGLPVYFLSPRRVQVSARFQF